MSVQTYYKHISTTIKLRPINYAVNSVIVRLEKNLEDIPTNEPIAIFGAGVHTINLLDAIEFKNRIFIVDSNESMSGKYLGEHKIYSSDLILKMKFRYILISSCKYQFEIENFLINQVGFEGSIINIYDEIDVHKNNPFYGEISMLPNWSREYSNFINKLSIHKEHSETRRRILKDLISAYIYEWSFVQARKFIEIYIQENYNDVKKYSEVLKFLTKIEHEIKFKLKGIPSENNKPNVCIIIVDSARKDLMGCYGFEKNNTPFLNSIKKDSIIFNKAYSTSTYTLAAFASILSGKLPFELNIFDKKPQLDNEDNLLCKELKKRGYKILSGMYRMSNIYGNDLKDKYIDFSSNSTFLNNNVMWEMLDSINHSPFFIITHIMDTHYPYYHTDNFNTDINKVIDTSMRSEGIANVFKANKQYFDLLKKTYVDAQYYVDIKIKYLVDMLPENTLFIIMGDHGQSLGEKRGYRPLGWYEETISIPLIIHKKNLKGYIVEDLFSIINLKDLILDYVDDNIIKIQKKDYIINNRGQLYSKELKKHLANECRAFRLIRTEYEKLIEFDDGEVQYYKLPNEINSYENYNNELLEILKNTPSIRHQQSIT